MMSLLLFPSCHLCSFYHIKDKTEHSTQNSDKNVHREVTCNIHRNIVQHEHMNPEFRIGVNIDTSLILQINKSLR